MTVIPCYFAFVRALLTTAPTSFEGEMKLGERNDAAIMTTLTHDDIGSARWQITFNVTVTKPPKILLPH